MQEEKINKENSFIPDGFRQQYQEFMELATHNLLAPLRKLGILTEKLTGKFSNNREEEVHQYTSRIQACVTEMRSLIEGIAELGRALPDTMRYERCDVGEIINRILQESAVLIKERQVTISTEEMPVLEGDKAQLRLLFKNVLENSLKFNQPGIPLEIRLTAERPTAAEKEDFKLRENRSYYKITIADNGIGLGPGTEKRIFEPLFRLHGKSEFPGNGLGLALVKRVAENHSGMVYAEDSGEKGTRIVLIIPDKP